MEGRVPKEWADRLAHALADRPAVAERIRKLPNWRIADLPLTHRAFYQDLYGSDEQIRTEVVGMNPEEAARHILAKTFVNAPTNCATCHQ